MTELLPCWKCGSPAHMLPTVDARVMIACPESGLGAEHGALVIEDTEEQAIAAWNTRAGGYCAFAQPTDLTDGCALITERTCHAPYVGYIEAETVDCYECDSCHGRIRLAFTTPNYCPNCGSKVVEE